MGDETRLSKWPIGRQRLQDAFGRFVPGVLIQRGSCRVWNISRWKRGVKRGTFAGEKLRNDTFKFQFCLINVRTKKYTMEVVIPTPFSISFLLLISISVHTFLIYFGKLTFI